MSHNDNKITSDGPQEPSWKTLLKHPIVSVKDALSGPLGGNDTSSSARQNRGKPRSASTSSGDRFAKGKFISVAARRAAGRRKAAVESGEMAAAAKRNR